MNSFRFRLRPSEIKIFLLNSILCLIFLINSLFLGKLKSYYMIFLLLFFLFFFYIFLGVEKTKYRYKKDILLEVLIYSLIFLGLYYVLGILIGFSSNKGYYNIYSIFTFIIPTIGTVVLKEILRKNIITKIQDNKLLVIYSVVMFIFMDLSTALYVQDLTNSASIFKFVALYLLPAISNNVVMSYLTLKCGYEPCILYMLITKLYVYLVPFVPNPSEYVKSIVELIMPILLWFRLNRFYQRDKDEFLDRDYRKSNYFSYLVTGLIMLIIIYFVSGYFRYFAIVVVSNSMNPVFYRGDIVIVDQKIKKDVPVGQMIAYKKDDTIVLHRIVNIEQKEARKVYYTQGDANDFIDPYDVEEDTIIGIIKLRIPYIGYPTVWLSELK